MSKNIARKATTGLLTLVLTTGAGIGLASTASAAPATGGTVVTGVKSSAQIVSSPDGWAAVRSGPGTKYKMVGKLKNGAKVTVYETKGGWSRIGKCEWVASWLLTTKSKPDCPSKGCSTPTPPKDPCKDKGDKCSTPPKDECKDKGKDDCKGGKPEKTCTYRVVIDAGKKADKTLKAVQQMFPDAFINSAGQIQVGAFTNKANADAALAKAQKCWDASIVTECTKGGGK